MSELAESAGGTGIPPARAATDPADGDDSALARMDVARDNCLKGQNDICTYDKRINADMGRCPMRTFAVDFYPEAV